MATTLVTFDEVKRELPANSAIVKQAEDITIEAPEDYEIACSFLTMVVDRKNFAFEKTNPVVESAHKTWKAACALRTEATSPWEVAEGIAKKKIAAYDEKKEQERKRLEQEQTAFLLNQRQEQAITEATQLEAQGDKELADLVLEEAANAPAPVVVLPPLVQKQEGIAKTVNWKWRYKDGEAETLRLLVKAAAADDRWLAYLCANETAFGGDARTKKNLAKVPGVEFYPEHSVSVRTKGR
jgi:hypothetical protein